MHFELPIGAFLSGLLVLVPLPWHWRARNIPTLTIIAWVFISNIFYGVNAIIWADNVRIVATVWCDIVTKLQIGATMALPACCLCLCIHLERIASVRQSGTTDKDRRKWMIFDLVICWLIPMIYMATHYVVQGHRYDIIETMGCRPATYNSIQSILLIWLPPLVAVALTFIYASLSLYHFCQRRLTFARHLHNSNSALTPSRYFRLMVMAVALMVWGTVVTAVNMWFTLRTGLRPWISWEDVHWEFSRVDQFPLQFIPANVLAVTYFSWWMVPITGFMFFFFFSFGADAIKEYRACWEWVLRVIFRRKPTSSKKSALTPSPIKHHVQLAKKLSTTSSYTFRADGDTKKSEYELSPKKTILSDTSSSLYSPTSPTCSTPTSSAWSDALPTAVSDYDHPPSAPYYEHRYSRNDEHV